MDVHRLERDAGLNRLPAYPPKGNMMDLGVTEYPKLSRKQIGS